MPAPVKLLDMKPVGHYADRAPIYSFQTSFPTRGVRSINDLRKATEQEAYDAGRDWLKNWVIGDPWGRMGQVLGVTQLDDGQFTVVNTFWSST